MKALTNTKAKRHVIYTIATEGYNRINKLVLCNAISGGLNKVESGQFTPQPDMYEKLPDMLKEFKLFKPKGVMEGDKWWGNSFDGGTIEGEENNEARYFALALMLEMTRPPKKKKKK